MVGIPKGRGGKEMEGIVLMPYVVMALKAVTIFVVGWIVSKISRAAVTGICRKFEVLEKQKELPESAGNLVYYFILLVTIVAVLEALGLKYVTQPFVDLLNKIATYIPNIIGAGVIFIVGFFFARVAKEFTRSLLETFQVESLGKKYGIENLGNTGANVIYFVVLLFVIVASLNALQIKVITEPAINMINSILIAIPKVVAAGIVFGSIYFIGKIAAELMTKVVSELNVEKLAKEVGISSEKLKFEELTKYLVLSFAVLLGFAQAFNYLEAKALYEITYQFIHIAFKLVVASFIVFAGTYFGNLIEKRVEKQNLGKVAKAAFIAASVFLSLPYIGISPKIIEIIVLSISLGVGVAFALAFGMGGREVASEILRKIFLK